MTNIFTLYLGQVDRAERKRTADKREGRPETKESREERYEKLLKYFNLRILMNILGRKNVSPVGQMKPVKPLFLDFQP